MASEALAGRLHVSTQNGTQPLLGGIIDLRFAAGGETPRPITPGQALVARMELEAVDVVVPKGAQIHLEVGVTGHGTEELIGGATYYQATPGSGPLTLHAGGDQSVLRVLSFERADDVLFTPPHDR